MAADAFGPAAEKFARLFGTPKYLLWQTVIVLGWIAVNAVAWSLRWDKYPFILLNLVFSTQAAYAAPLILLAQNRQADRDKAEMERDRERNARALADMEFLAREIAGIRVALESKADREDLVDPLWVLGPARLVPLRVHPVQTPRLRSHPPRRRRRAAGHGVASGRCGHRLAREGCRRGRRGGPAPREGRRFP